MNSNTKFMSVMAKLTKEFLSTQTDAQLLEIREEFLSEAFSRWAIDGAQNIMKLMDHYGPHAAQRELNDKDITLLLNIMLKYVGANVFLPSLFRASATNDPATLRSRAYAALDSFAPSSEDQKNVH